MPRRLLFLFLLLSTTAAHAATYYVSTSGTAASPGTIERPLRTIASAIRRLKAGDQIYVRQGRYRETVTIWQLNGGENAPIRISPFRGEKVIVDGSGSKSNGVFVIGRSSYIHLDGFEVTNGRNAGIYVYDSHHINVRENTVHDCNHGGINANSSDESPFGTTHDILISGNTVFHCVLSNKARNNDEQVWMQGVAAYRADRVEISNNYVYENYGEGIDYILSDRGTIRGNRIHDNYSINLYLDNAQSTTVDSNLIWCSAGNEFYRGGAPAAGIGSANERYPEQNPLNDLTISNNVVLRCHAGFSYGSYERGGGLHNTVITNNVFYATNYAAVWIQGRGHDSTIVANNVLYQKYGRAYASVPSSGIAFRNNSWFGGGDPSTIVKSTGDITADPMLTNPGGGEPKDYQLKAGSPLIDAGTNAGTVPNDYFGTARAGRGKARDIGIHEY